MFAGCSSARFLTSGAPGWRTWLWPVIKVLLRYRQSFFVGETASVSWFAHHAVDIESGGTGTFANHRTGKGRVISPTQAELSYIRTKGYKNC